ncbi:MAG: DNA-binding domain-containing protein [Pseudomonadota bacterium]
MSVTQTAFRAALLSPDMAAPSGLSDGQGKPARKRFDVYRNNVAASLTEALVAAFPTIHGLVGDAFFRALSGLFLRQHPPSSPLMMHYGEAMPEFLAGFAPVAHLPYLSDIARLDLARRRAYHAADAEALAPSAFEIAPEALLASRVTLAPAAEIISSRFPIHDIFEMQRGGPKPTSAAQCVVISRPELDPELDVVSADAARFLLELQNGATIGDALAPSPDPAALLTPVLTLALRRRLFTTLT